MEREAGVRRGKMMNTSEVLNRGMECMGSKFDYTKWQREYFDRIPEKQLHEEAVAYAKAHPYQEAAKVIVSSDQTNLEE